MKQVTVKREKTRKQWFTVMLDPVALHHFILLLEADGQKNLKYKRLVDRRLAGAFQASYS